MPINRGFRCITQTGTKEGTSFRKQLCVPVFLLMFSGSLIRIFVSSVVSRMLLVFRIMQRVMADP